MNTQETMIYGQTPTAASLINFLPLVTIHYQVMYCITVVLRYKKRCGNEQRRIHGESGKNACGRKVQTPPHYRSSLYPWFYRPFSRRANESQQRKNKAKNPKKGQRIIKLPTALLSLFAILCLALIFPLSPIGAQDSSDSWADLVDWSDTSDSKTETETPKAATQTPETPAPKAAPETPAPKAAEPKTLPKVGGQTPSLKAPKIQGPGSVTAIINTVIGYIAKIGGIFGKSAGTRIGGTSGSAIIMLVIAKLVQDKAPSWVQWLLYLSGGTMAAGSGANITKLIMGLIN